ncbi:MAG: hypothetical protein ICV62_04455 [Cyanobacteria bacterium Co-bin13]|nr:hypothetical protein [Cyanobacteria bacterium Co-bin13]
MSGFSCAQAEACVWLSKWCMGCAIAKDRPFRTTAVQLQRSLRLFVLLKQPMPLT